MQNFIKTPKKVKIIIGIAALSLTLGGCLSSGEPFAYTAIHEIPPGPGLVSGDEGGLTIHLGGNKAKPETARRANPLQARTQRVPQAQVPQAQIQTVQPVASTYVPSSRRMVESVTQQ